MALERLKEMENQYECKMKGREPEQGTHGKFITNKREEYRSRKLKRNNNADQQG